MPRVHYSSCPLCESRDIHPLLTAKDYMVSSEDFVIWQCEHCSLRFTQDVPDETSIGPYYKSEEYISHTNKANGRISKLYQSVRRHTITQKANLLNDLTQGRKGNILDVGAGTGSFLAAMKKAGWNVTGIEPDESARRVALDDHQLDLKNTDALYELPPASFDVITLWHVLEHVHDLHEYIEHLRSLLKPDGKLIIAVPNYTSVDAGIYTLSWAAYDVPRHLYHFTPKSINILAAKHRMKVIDQKPMWFDSFYISLLSSKYRHGKTKWIEAIISGLRSNITTIFNKGRCSSLTYILEKN